VLGPEARSVLRITLETEDIGMVVEALRQAAEDLPPSAGA
jgi:ribosomal protein L16/L10AE